MKLITKTLLLSALLGIWPFQAGLMHGQEQSAKVINDLVKQVDDKLTKLEKSVEVQQKTKISLQAELAQAVNAYRESKDPVSKAEAKADVINALARQNQGDRGTVSATINTVSGVIMDLGQIEKHIAKGPHSPQAILAQRERLRNVLLNAGPILASVQQGLTDPKAQASAKLSEQTLLFYYNMLRTPVHAVTNSAAEISRTLEMLNGICVQLKVIDDMLQQEKNILTASVYAQLTEAALLRLANTRLGTHDLRKIPDFMQQDIVHRMTNYTEIVNGGVQSESDSLEPSSDSVLDLIRQGNIPK